MVPEYQREEIREVLAYSYRIIYRVGDFNISIIARTSWPTHPSSSGRTVASRRHPPSN